LRSRFYPKIRRNFGFLKINGMAREIERQRYNMEKLKVYFRNGMIKFEIQVKVGDVVKC